MAEPGNDALADEVGEMLKAAGVSNYIVMFADPDSEYDQIRVFGSRFWRCGAAMEILDEVRDARRRERAEEASP
jgi:hypothetical protein